MEAVVPHVGKKTGAEWQGRSKPGKADSANSQEDLYPKYAKVVQLLQNIFDGMRGEDRKAISAADYERQRHDFAFHMTDWWGDLKWLYRLYEHPDAANRNEALTSMIAFLIHVIPHLNAAHRLLLEEEVSDPFGPEKKSPRRLRRLR